MFYEWIAQCCELMGKPLTFGVNMMPGKDPSWFWAFDDGLTPKQAVEKYQEAICGCGETR